MLIFHSELLHFWFFFLVRFIEVCNTYNKFSLFKCAVLWILTARYRHHNEDPEGNSHHPRKSPSALTATTPPAPPAPATADLVSVSSCAFSSMSLWMESHHCSLYVWLLSLRIICISRELLLAFYYGALKTDITRCSWFEKPFGSSSKS